MLSVVLWPFGMFMCALFDTCGYFAGGEAGTTFDLFRLLQLQ